MTFNGGSLVKDRSYRVTALWQPTDTLSFQGMYQRRETRSLQFDQVAGPGSSGGPGGLPGMPPWYVSAIKANFNGPALNVANRAAVESSPSNVFMKIDLLPGQQPELWELQDGHHFLEHPVLYAG